MNVLDLRNKINSYFYRKENSFEYHIEYHIEQNKDRLEQIEIFPLYYYFYSNFIEYSLPYNSTFFINFVLSVL